MLACTYSGAYGLFSRLSRGKENRVPDERSWRAVDRHGARCHRSCIRRKVWQHSVGLSSHPPPILPPSNVRFSAMEKPATTATYWSIDVSFRMAEPDPNHTLEERVVHWYFSQLDKNSSGDIGKKEIKPFKRFLRKKSKPKKCVKKFVEYCDISNDKAISLQELMGCLGVTKEEGDLRTPTWYLRKCIYLHPTGSGTDVIEAKVKAWKDKTTLSVMWHLIRFGVFLFRYNWGNIHWLASVYSVATLTRDKKLCFHI